MRGEEVNCNSRVPTDRWQGTTSESRIKKTAPLFHSFRRVDRGGAGKRTLRRKKKQHEGGGLGVDGGTGEKSAREGTAWEKRLVHNPNRHTAL